MRLEVGEQLSNLLGILLESRPLHSPEGAYRRTLRSVVRRYLLDDLHLMSGRRKGPRVPRFLLNDIVRFWRTMCVDFGTKFWQEDGKKWAIRNIKLRMSRKLIFVSGLLLAFSCYEELNGAEKPTSDVERILEKLVEGAELPPLELIVRELLRVGVTRATADLVEIYNEYLGHLNDDTLRSQLEEIEAPAAYEHPIFQRLRELSKRFEKTLNQVFFAENELLRDFILKYGVF